ncbi:hypothetical protein KY285_002413 [Solanum tuberosum]|nr:hypothetical protein KY285_002413 [Solanum tuberosum]
MQEVFPKVIAPFEGRLFDSPEFTGSIRRRSLVRFAGVRWFDSLEFAGSIRRNCWSNIEGGMGEWWSGFMVDEGSLPH